MHVLLTDPDPLLAERLHAAVRPEDGDLVVTRDADAARRHLADHPVDLAVLDIHVAHGLELLEDLASRSPSPEIVVLTLLDDEITRSACMGAGADHFFSKAAGLDPLLDLLHRGE